MSKPRGRRWLRPARRWPTDPQRRCGSRAPARRGRRCRVPMRATASCPADRSRTAPRSVRSNSASSRRASSRRAPASNAPLRSAPLRSAPEKFGVSTNRHRAGWRSADRRHGGTPRADPHARNPPPGAAHGAAQRRAGRNRQRPPRPAYGCADFAPSSATSRKSARAPPPPRLSTQVRCCWKSRRKLRPGDWSSHGVGYSCTDRARPDRLC